jgi:hypothetical protein
MHIHAKEWRSIEMNTLNNLNTVIAQLQQNAARIGITIAGLLVAIYAVKIMLDQDTSPAARAERWSHLKRVFLCAAIIAAAGAFVQLATSLGQML